MKKHKYFVKEEKDTEVKQKIYTKNPPEMRNVIVNATLND